jgi:peptidoglycan/LPS O-acetylase OafA/YrhL
VLGLFAGMVLFKKGVFGQFPDPAFFPGAGPIFLVGIATRLWLADINRFTVSPVVSICALGFGLIFKDVLWLAVWVALISYFVNREAWLEAGNRLIVKVIEVTLESPVARYLGARSYSVYLLHTAVIQLAIWSVSAVWPNLSRGQLFVAVFAIAPIAILIFSDLLYRCLEHPLTVFGGQLASRMKVREKLAAG